VKNSRAFQSPGLVSLSSISLQLSITGMYQVLRHVRRHTTLGEGVARAWSRGTADAGAVREGLREAEQEPFCGRGGDLRGGSAADVALRAGQDGGATNRLAAAPGSEEVSALAHQRTALVHALRAHLAEFGVIAPQGLRHVAKLIAMVRDDGDVRLPNLARQVLQVLGR
jgi:hypothetical protein